MKKTPLIATLLFVIFFLPTTVTGLFTSSHTLTGTLTQETSAYFIGRTTLEGLFKGQPLEHLVDSTFVQQMNGFPILGASRITNLETVIVAEDIDITNATSLEDLVVQNYDHITFYTDVEINTEDGFFLLGINEGTMNLSTELPYAVTTIIPLEVVPDTTTRFLVIGTLYPITMQCSTTFAAMTRLSDNGTITITTRDGQILWMGGSSNDYILIQDTSFTLLKQQSLSLLPLEEHPLAMVLTETIVPAASSDIQIQQLLHNVSVTLEDFPDETSGEFLQSIHDLSDLLETSGFIANGAMILQNANDTVTVDHTLQRFSSDGFVRFNTVSVSDFDSSTGVSIKGDCTLCYLGSHFFNPSAKRSNDGITFPFELLFLWILSLVVFLYVRFFLRPPIDTSLDKKMKRYGLIVHLITLVSAFILLDMEVNILIGTSVLSSLVTQGFSLGTAALFLLEAIIWIVGFCLLAIPIQLLSYAILRYLGIEKGGNGFWKAVGDLSIWVFSGFYLLLFLNILLSVIDFNSLLTFG